MTDTPQLRSAFPRTPRTSKKLQKAEGIYNGTSSLLSRKEPDIVTLHDSVTTKSRDVNGPLIPFDIIDPPSQRLYVAAFYVLLNAWRLYEYWQFSDDLDATWLFLKWISIDAFFLFGLPALRIPWLEWAFSASLAVFLLHVLANVFLMFHIPIPFSAWMAAFVKVAYDRELSISERRVNPADILHNSSLILGKQIIHILPEGSAILNPEQHPFCLDEARSTVHLPIRINQTLPIAIELIRFDLETTQNETIVVSQKLLKSMKRQAEQTHKFELLGPRDLLYPASKTGIYQLGKVIDESRLEVHRRLHDTPVVVCPKAIIQESSIHKCKGDLSNLTLEIEGSPPLKIKYSRILNDVDHGVSYQSIQPGNFANNPARELDPPHTNIAWPRGQKIKIPLNESLEAGGQWTYLIDEIHDAYGNIMNYTELRHRHADFTSQSQRFFVHERPRLSFLGCNSQTSLQAATGETIELPVHFHSVGDGQLADGPFTLGYSFFETFPRDDPQESGDIRDFILGNVSEKPRIKNPGWYSIISISSRFCSGDILEPSSCLLHNPPMPRLSIRKDFIYDKCANNAVGLSVDLDLIGTPPFIIRYSIEHSKGAQTRILSIDSLRGHLDLTPSDAGHYRYRFLDISDHVYDTRSLKSEVPILEQNVKPVASAQFVGPVTSRKACFAEPVSIDISFLGQRPWELQYELIHNGKRTNHNITSDSEIMTLTIEKLLEGGEYILGLVSVTDKSKCKRSLKEEIKIEARPKRPSAAFGKVDEKRAILALEDKMVDLPLRLEGEAPWRLKYRNILHTQTLPVEKVLWDENSQIQVDQAGKYELLDVSDATCPGTVDPIARVFNVSWIARPSITAVDGHPLDGKTLLEKTEVCEGDEDTMDIKLHGNPPYAVRYEQQYEANSGGISSSIKTLVAALHTISIRMESSKAGKYSYKFINIGDNLYMREPRDVTPLTVRQLVNPRPSAQFQSEDRNYGFCKEEGEGHETIPIVLEGVPPFTLEIGIKHHSNLRPDIISIPNINTRQFNLPVPRRYLDLGQHVVSIRKVRDARGCLQTTGYGGSSVRVTMSDVPTIIPLESKTDYCVGERISFSLSGYAPFNVYYTFDGMQRRAHTQTTSFRRIAEKPGEFIVTAISDGASGKCKSRKNIKKNIHEMPSVKISRGEVSVVDIHEGGEAEILFEFWGTPPFEFTYTRSSNAAKGTKPQILDTKHDISYEYTKTIRASDEGTYEVVAIKDKYCSFSTLSDRTKRG
ncbi:hypothetical protein LOZ66_006737 [Ophidiomyces ophidiicola]|nr:hypothetical protein LOZ66_006737 [Ophidiomyces ophidiicola]